MAILAFHGTDDPLVPYRNGAVGLSLPGVHVRGTMLNMGDWARLGRCSRVVQDARLRGSCGARSGRIRAAGKEVSLYTIEHGGHVWPGAAGGKEQVDGTGLALDFFDRHHL